LLSFSYGKLPTVENDSPIHVWAISSPLTERKPAYMLGRDLREFS
jgi:hypothetical protein